MGWALKKYPISMFILPLFFLLIRALLTFQIFEVVVIYNRKNPKYTNKQVKTREQKETLTFSAGEVLVPTVQFSNKLLILQSLTQFCF